MKLFTHILNTGALPQTFSILNQILPNIYTSKCFNDANLPFAREVKRTEIGHLFEHILLEYLFQMKIRQGEKNAVMKGETSWNWKRDPRGVFHIIINAGIQDATILPFALQRATVVLEKILQTNKN